MRFRGIRSYGCGGGTNDVAASLQVYHFRPFTGDIQEMFRQTLLREWIDPQYQEGSLAAPPRFGSDSIPGAQGVLVARFSENVAGLPRPHVRVVVIAGAAAAIVDMSAQSAQSWERAWPAMSATLASLRVDQVAPPPSVAGGPGVTGTALAGLFVGTVWDYRPDLQGRVGQGYKVSTTYYYLLSADGRVYRGVDLSRIPGGDISRFDYEMAQRDHPDDTGRYTVRGKQLFIQMGGRPQPMIIAATPEGNQLVIEGVAYVRR